MSDNEKVFPSKVIEVTLPSPDAFLQVKETLERMGLPGYKNNVLTQTCHILHRRGRYAILHFKEVFRLNGQSSVMSREDYLRRNLIVRLLRDWGLVNPVVMPKAVDIGDMSMVKVISHADRKNWTLRSNCKVGARRPTNDDRVADAA